MGVGTFPTFRFEKKKIILASREPPFVIPFIFATFLMKINDLAGIKK